jgi:hypothetical protein
MTTSGAGGTNVVPVVFVPPRVTEPPRVVPDAVAGGFLSPVAAPDVEVGRGRDAIESARAGATPTAGGPATVAVSWPTELLFPSPP